ncbi:MAG: hypothetical protein HZA29_00030 [Candidatus Omnitrophica bacterium]|nr:hypothetical protein [Candidatus Omnitrophota bacterium]
MSLAKFMKYSVAITFIALVYIHLQMQIVDLAYQGQAKEAKIKDLVDRNGNTYYAISRLKSANHLGGVMLSKDSKMQFAGRENIIVLAGADAAPDTGRDQTLKKPNVLLSLLSFATQAEARNKE